MDPMMDIQAVESKLNDVTVTPIPMNMPKLPQNLQLLHQQQLYQQYQQQMQQQSAAISSRNTVDLATMNTTITSTNNGLSKYAQLLAVIEEMGRDIRPTYSGSRSSAERLKRGIVHARILVRECLMETERSARQ